MQIAFPRSCAIKGNRNEGVGNWSRRKFLTGAVECLGLLLGIVQEGKDLVMPSTGGVVSLGPSTPRPSQRSPDREVGQGRCEVAGRWLDV